MYVYKRAEVNGASSKRSSTFIQRSRFTAASVSPQQVQTLLNYHGNPSYKTAFKQKPIEEEIWKWWKQYNYAVGIRR